MKDYNETLAERFYLQACARNLLPDHRVNCCLRRIVPTKRSVELWRNSHTRRAHYRNLATCSCIWICPVCAAKISEHRRKEINQAVTQSKYVGLSPILVTYTMRHNCKDLLSTSLLDLMSAYAAQTSGGGWVDIKQRHQINSYIRTIEMTHGYNGWHPHLHVLMFVDTDLSKLSDELSQRWLQILKTIGRNGLNGIACDVRVSNDAIADYIAKWGHQPIDEQATKDKYWTMEHELSKATSKKAQGTHRNPFQILYDSGTGDKRSAALFREYAETTKGKRQLEWSRTPNLKRAYGIVDYTDEEIMDKHDQEAVLLARLTIDQWHAVIRNAGVCTLLQIAGSGSLTELQTFLMDIGAGNPFANIDVT